jgi:dCMP deaminase|tara:strand:+ start:80 stop:538 length:459 start_codon:yes stop_codon:yes gene_type:complete
MRWVEYFQNLAHNVKLKSKDISTQVGAVIVGKDKEIVSTGYNSFPRGINDMKLSRQERPEKYYWFEHAERNAIYNAARIGVSTKGCTMYLTCGIPCADCCRGIINSGIVRIFCERSSGPNSPMWKEHAERSWEMFDEAGVEVKFYDNTTTGI